MLTTLCKDVQHVFGPQADGSWIETYTDGANGAVLFSQPIVPYKPTRTPPGQVAREQAWCIDGPLPVATAQQPVIVDTPGIVEASRAHEPGMGGFFLLVLVATGGIAAFKHYHGRPLVAAQPQFLPNPWANLPKPNQSSVDLERYGDFLERQYPPLPEERLYPETGTSSVFDQVNIASADRGYVPVAAAAAQNSGQTEQQNCFQHGANLPTNHPQTEGKPSANLVQTGTPTFDPRESETPGEYEFFQALIRLNNWSPTGKDILKALWKAHPNTARYEPAIERRNQFAERMENAA